jgi:hypothetical protein
MHALTGELGVENALSAATDRGNVSHGTHVDRDRGLKAQDTISVDQDLLAISQSLFDHRSHGHQKGPLSVFDRLDNDCCRRKQIWRVSE